MAIYRLISGGKFDPEQIEAMTGAYEGVLSDMKIADRNDPLTEIIAKSIIAVTTRGERDPDTIKDRALNALGVRIADSAA
jgi:hypothetical protein